MAVATNTTLGEIRLAGDLAGNNNGLAPELKTSGVTAGTYTLPELTVNAKGLITAAQNAPASTILSYVPTANTTRLGIVQIGSGVNVTSGVISIPTASSSVRGAVKVDTASTPFTLTSGALGFDANKLKASASTLGTIRVGTNLTIDGSGILSAVFPFATTSVAGIVSIGSNINVDVNSQI